jgi:uncharacterized protein (TIGR00730 family)
MPEKTISIFGTARAKPDSAIYNLAYETGFCLASAGYAIANGGYDGSMLASAKGARKAGAKTIGVTCSAFGQKPANEYITEEIRTASLDQRLDTLIELGQAYIVLPGGTGTLLELAKVWELKNKNFLNMQKPIILIGDFWQPLTEIIKADDPKSCQTINLVEKPDQIIALLKESGI